jgi:hypothetical protein
MEIKKKKNEDEIVEELKRLNKNLEALIEAVKDFVWIYEKINQKKLRNAIKEALEESW